MMVTLFWLARREKGGVKSSIDMEKKRCRQQKELGFS
jgi:hypothetical protein